MRKLLISLIAISFLCGCVKSKEDKTTIKIMSFNIRYDEPKDGENNWKFRRLACVNMINDQQPDVFGIQEGLVHQVSFLDSALVDFAYVGEGRDSLIKNNEYTAIFYHTGKFDLIRSGTNWLSETPEVSSKGWDAKYNRIMTWAHLKNKNNNKEFIVLNTHFDHRGAQARVESAKLITQKAAELSGDTLVTFVVGDFNTLPNDSLLIPIYQYFKSAQSTATQTDSLGTTNEFKVTQEGRIIDYIFYRFATPTLYQTIIKDYGVPYISDHYPIMTVFEY